ncbi:MAG: putative tpr repeat protein [uncultured bacterium]|nr:MAG: putative tpr repeat protein [uncultured bacterium]
MKVLNIIDKYLFLSLIFLYPLFFLLIFQSPFDTAKLLLLAVGILLLTTVKIVKTILLGDFKFYSSKIDVLIVAFVIICVISSILSPLSKFDSFVLPGATSLIVFSTFMYFFVNQFIQKEKNVSENVLIVSAVIASILQIISFLNIPALKFIGNNFSSLGNIISSLTFFAIILPFAFYKAIRENDITNKILFGLAGFVIFIGLSLSAYSVLPLKNTSPKLLSLSNSWSIAIDTLKANPLFGVGPANYLASFNKFRPITFNSTPDWNVKYIVSRNTPLTVMVELGLLGVIIFLSIFFVSLRPFSLENPNSLSVLIFLIISLIFPISPVLFPIFFLLIALNTKTREVGGIFTSKIPAFVMTIPFIAFVLFVSFVSYKAFYSEYLFNKMINLKTYEDLNKVLQINPYSDRYHLVAAELNLAIANSIAKKTDIKDEDKNTISQLIQQSITEAKAAVSLNPQKASNWDNLGNIYTSISSFAKDANQFAIEAYSQAIFLDPINPLLRIRLGGIYYSDQKYEDAVKIFELAVLAKPDFANSHFNLAMAYKGNKQIEKAKEQLNITLTLVEKDSKDYELVKKELDTIDEKVENTEANPIQTENLTPPATPSPTQEPQIEIPTE